MWQVSVFLLCLSLAAPPVLANLAFESSGDLVFQVYKGSGDTSAQLITIIDNSGDARKAGLRAEGTSTWLQLPTAEMQLQHGRNQLQLAVDASELKPGRYHGAVVLTAMDGTANSVRKEVELRVFCGELAPGSARLLEAPQVVVERLSRWEDGSDHAHVSVSLPWPQPQLLPEHLQVNAGKGRVLGVWEEEEEMCSKFKVHVSAPGAPAAADQAAQMQVELLPASAEAAAAIETTSLATRRLLQEEEGEGPICRLYAVDMGFCAPEGLITQESSTVLVVSCREVVVGICPPCFNVTGPPGVIVKYVGLFEGFDTFYEVSISWDSEYTGPVSVDINCPIFTLNGGDAVEIPPLNFTAGGLDMPALLVANSYRLEAADAAAGGTRRRIFSTKRN